MRGAEVYPVLRDKGINQLFHANSVKTSVSFLRLGGLASREHVERQHMPQTPQYTDDIDRRFGIWNDVFTDSADIHSRISDKNQYGPVLFVLDSRLLIDLPPEIDVLITKSNPTKWSDGQQHGERYFTAVAELAAEIVRGRFDQMITFRFPDGILRFGAYLQQVILDDPQVGRADRIGDFAPTLQALQSAAAAGQVGIPITQRSCRVACRCTAFYANNSDWVRKFFAI